MPLDKEKILKIWEDRHTSRTELDLATYDNARQAFHARLTTRAGHGGDYEKEFLAKVERILGNAEKFRVFKDLMPYPLPSTQVISKATDEWNKIFFAEDRQVELYFEDDQTEAEATAFLENQNVASFVAQDVFTTAKQAVNSIAVIDTRLEVSAEGDLETVPFVFLIGTGDCVHIALDSKHNISSLSYTVGKQGDSHHLIVIDQIQYAVYPIEKGAIGGVLTESPHLLGYCPVSFIWHDVVDPKNGIRRFNAIIEALEDLDLLTMAEVFSRHTDLYAAFPILWRYFTACTYQDAYGHNCNSGRVAYLDSEGREVNIECPACKNKTYVGPGEQLDVDVPQGPEDQKLGQPAGFINADRSILDYNVEKIERLRSKVSRFLTGFDDSSDGKGARQYNMDQVASMNESRHAVLQYWAENIEKTDKFITETMCRLRYAEAFLGSTFNYGSDWLLADFDSAVKSYADAKLAGLPMYLIEPRRKTLERLQVKGSPGQAERVRILSELEPYVDLPLDKVPPGRDYTLKADFGGLIARFERENIDITQFGKDLSFNTRITKIKSILYSYVKTREGILRQPGRQKGAPATPGMGEIKE